MRANGNKPFLVAAALAILCVGCSKHERSVERGLPAPSPQPGPTASSIVPRYHALVIGISDYESHGAEGWDRLATARKDAEALADVLEGRFGFQVTRLFDRDASRARIVEALDDLVALQSNDAVLIYFAGHGQYESSIDEGYWIPADGRRMDGKRSAKADWIWNSMVTKMIAASQARHILVVADACYGGSLFRGGATPVLEEDFHWYARALRAPSRYLITSGDLEPVLDSGGRHSVFAQELLNFLEHTDRPVFSASDVGFALREKVSTLTGQLVRMGPLAVSTHAGGEFVFVAKDSVVEWPSPDQLASTAAPFRGQDRSNTPEPSPSAAQLMQDAVEMKDQGASRSAGQIAQALANDHPGDAMALAVAAYVRGEDRDKERSAIRDLLDRIDKNRAAANQAGQAGQDLVARPRVIACLGPSAADASAGSEAVAHMARICLRARLETHASFRVVEREAIEDLLAEMNLGTSSLSDKEASLQVGRLLPACLIVLGDLLPRGEGFDVFVRLVDTETTRILASLTTHADNRDDLPGLCERLADDIVHKAQAMKPLTARVLQTRGGTVEAGLGTFHGIDTGMTFALLQRDGDAGTARETKVGTAHAVKIGDTQSEFAPAWTVASASVSGPVWLVEAADPAP